MKYVVKHLDVLEVMGEPIKPRLFAVTSRVTEQNLGGQSRVGRVRGGCYWILDGTCACLSARKVLLLKLKSL